MTETIESVWNLIIEYGIATEEELQLVTDIKVQYRRTK